MKIIIVDDEISALKDFLGQVILREDVHYRFFDDNPDAILSFLKANPIDGAFLDVRMPGIGGFELAKRILEVYPSAKIAFFTGLSITMKDVPESIKDNVIDILYKPYDVEDLDRALHKIGSAVPKMSVTMFGSFDCFLDRRPLSFSSAKSKELFAFLLANRGKTVTMAAAIKALWGDRDPERAKKLYRDAVWRLRQTLSNAEFNCVEFGRAVLSVDLTNIQCDYYQYLNDPESVYYGGDFLSAYPWGQPMREELDYLASKAKGA